MGRISMKAVQQQVYNLNGSGEKSLAYVLRPTRYSTIDSKQIVDYCAQNSMVPKAYISGAMVALSQCITNFLLNGHHVVFPELGTFSLTSTGFAVGDVDKAGLDQLKKLNVRFLPCTDLKTLVDNVDVELDGVFEIAGETIITEATDTTEAKTQKYYRRVNARTVTADSDGNTTNGSSSAGSGTSGTTKRTLTLSASPSNGGTVSGAGQYNNGASATISATANSGYTFTRWSDGDTSASRSVVMDADKSLSAIFTATSGDVNNIH